MCECVSARCLRSAVSIDLFTEGGSMLATLAHAQTNLFRLLLIPLQLIILFIYFHVFSW